MMVIMKTISYLTFFVFVAAQVSLSQPTSPNFRIFPSAVTQTEPSITVSPVNPQLMFASGVTINTGNGFKSEGVYVSTNGGLQWFGSDTCKGALLANHGGDPGVVIDENGRLVITHIGSVFAGVYSHYSTDLGTSWSNAYTISSQQPEDKGTTTFDGSPSSPYYGRLYTAWVNLVIPYPVLSSYSTNSGQSWTSPLAVNTPPPARCSGGSIETGRDGKVYLAWVGMTSTSPFFEDFAGFASSTDGGATWADSQNIFDMNGINGTLPSKSNIRVNGLPQIVVDNSTGSRSGWLYIVTNEKNLTPAGTDADIILHRSTDGGTTWSSGIRVNQDGLSNGKIQYFPSMDIDQYGGVNILYYDDRNTASDSAEVYLARSTDGGETWTERVISDHRLKPKPIIGGGSNYQGDHIALKSVGDKLFALWMDDFSGLYQIWCTIFDLTVLDVRQSQSEVPSSFGLEQNYPNPFNPETVIRYSLPVTSDVTLKVYNVLGQEVAILRMNEEMKPGKYEVNFNAASLSSGVYFYRLQAGSFVETKKLVLMR